jgi:hypothetical protein
MLWELNTSDLVPTRQGNPTAFLQEFMECHNYIMLAVVLYGHKTWSLMLRE